MTSLIFYSSLIMITAVSAMEPTVSLQSFGEFEGEPVTLYTLTNQHGMVAKISNYGGVVVGLTAPNREGKFEEVVLGYDDFSSYEKDGGYFGAITGRYANRIAGGSFELDGKAYQLATNNGPNHIHGGTRGFNKRLWTATPSLAQGQPQLTLEYLSPDGEEGFPGNLKVTTVYTLTEKNGLQIDYRATSDQATLCNLTHHSYWNLGGPTSTTILDHELQLFSEAITPTDETAIPTGEFAKVEGTAFDFREAHLIGERIDEPHEQLVLGRGYDHNFLIEGEGGTLRPVARVVEPKSGRVMEMFSTDYGVQLYTGNYFDGSVKGREGRPFTHRIALCLECQRYPDSPNQPSFPSAALRPGEVYEKSTVYQFSVKK